MLQKGTFRTCHRCGRFCAAALGGGGEAALLPFQARRNARLFSLLFPECLQHRALKLNSIAIG